VKVSPIRATVSVDRKTLLQTVGHTNQQLIPNQVSHAVINHLEPIKIHKENREQLIIVTLRTFD